MAIRAIAVNVVREALRQKIVYITVLFTLMLFAIEPMLPSFQVGLRIRLFNDIALGVSYLAVAILAVALSVNQLPSEIEKRTIYNIISKPVKRSELLIGKFLGVLIVLFTCTLLMSIAITVFTYGYFGKLQIGLMQCAATGFLEGALISAFGVAMSTFTTPTVNVFACVLFYFAGHVKNSVLAGITSSNGAGAWVGKALKYVLPSLENFNVSEAVARGFVLKPVFLGELFIYSTIFTIALLSLGSIVLNRREL